MSTIGLGGNVTGRGWCELHDPSSTSMTLKLFSRSNITNRGATKRITFDGQEDSLEVGDSLSEIASFGDFKQALRTAREALSYIYPWKKSIAALEGFLISTNFCSRELGSAAGSGVSTLVKFVNHVFSQNGEKWRARADFLSTTTWRESGQSRQAPPNPMGHQETTRRTPSPAAVAPARRSRRQAGTATVATELRAQASSLPASRPGRTSSPLPWKRSVTTSIWVSALTGTVPATLPAAPG